VVAVADGVGGTQEAGQLAVVVGQFGQHAFGRDVLGVVVQQALGALNVTNGPDGGAADLAGALRNHVGGGEDLVTLLVQHQVVVAEVRAGQVPVEVLGLQVQREHVCQQRSQRAGDVGSGLGTQVGRGTQRGTMASLKGQIGHGISPE